jgi:hypothetical protein
MTEYELKPKDVFVLRRGGGPPRPPEPGIAGWLKRNRFKLALGLIIVEGILAAIYDISPFLLLVFAVAFVGLYLVYRTQLTNPAIKNAAFILAFSQAIVAVIPLFITVTVFAIVIVAAVVIAVMVMLLLGERSRR